MSILRSLPEMDREAIFLFYVEHRSATDIERDLGLETGHVGLLRAAAKASFVEGRRKPA
jgi:DNA-directed RNA polymerase specialized sigma24 family protein